MENVNDDVQYAVTRLTTLYNWNEEAARVYLHAKMLVVAKMRGVFELPFTHQFKQAAESVGVLSACSEQYDAGLKAVNASADFLKRLSVGAASLNYSKKYSGDKEFNTFGFAIGNSAVSVRDVSGETDEYFLEQARSYCSIGAYSSVIDHIRNINFGDLPVSSVGLALRKMQRDLAAWQYQRNTNLLRWDVDTDIDIVMCGIKEVSPS